MALVLLVVVAGLGWFMIQGKKTAPAPEAPVVDTTVMMDTDGDEVVEEHADAMVDVDAGALKDAEVGVMTSGAADTKAASVETTGTAKAIAITGKDFLFSQKEIRVKKGETVTINFESTQGFHDWVVDEFKAKTDQVRPGTKTSVTFVADKTGSFEYYCSVGKHRQNGMVGKLIIE